MEVERQASELVRTNKGVHVLRKGTDELTDYDKPTAKQSHIPTTDQI